MMRNFRPIGLCNTSYKLVTKIIVARIKPFLPLIIGPTQSSFLAGRRAADNAIIVQEYLNHFRKMKGKKGSMIIKIDLEKAFDRLEWSFIRDSLFYFNFPPNLSKVIMSCITTSSIAILINGTKTDFFEPSRGIRQGDPISPYIFIICMERLSRMIDEAIVAHSWTPISISKSGPKISHLFFADDLTLFARADSNNCNTIASILHTFCEISGQKLNLSKSRVLFSRNCSQEMINQCSTMLNIKASTSFGKYLGFPMFSSRLENRDYQFIIDNIQTKLSGWKTKLLNMTG